MAVTPSSSSSSPPRLYNDDGSSASFSSAADDRGGGSGNNNGEAIGETSIVVRVGSGDDVGDGDDSLASAAAEASRSPPSSSSSSSSPSSSVSPKSVAVVGGGARGKRRTRGRGRGRGGYSLVGGGEDDDDSTMDDGEEEGTEGEIFGRGLEKGDATPLGRDDDDYDDYDDYEEDEDWIDRVIGGCISRVVPVAVRSSPFFGMAYRALTSNFTSDEPPTIRRRRCGRRHRGRRDEQDDVLRLCAGRGAVRLFKFLAVTICLIIVVHSVARIPWLDWEHDADYTIRDFILYDLNHVCLDLTSFFLVGRLFDRGGVDRLFPTLIPMIVGAFSNSVMSKFRFLKYSFSLYEVACHWPWQLFLYVVLAVLTWTIVVLMHIRTMASMNILPSRLIEIGVTITLFLLPYVALDSNNFHFHHWYASWMLGMHANLDRWWSLATLAFVWGNYVNGVAVWGRDPILGCSYAFYVSTDGGGCNYMECYKGGEEEDGGYLPFVSPDWRNCSAEQNYIP